MFIHDGLVHRRFPVGPIAEVTLLLCATRVMTKYNDAVELHLLAASRATCAAAGKQVPYLKRVAIAHTLHHSEKYDGVPWGLFLGPQVGQQHFHTNHAATASA